MNETDYHFFLKTLLAKQWKKVGTERRAGVATPLFSVYSENSIGIGEFPDLKLLVDWTKKAGMSIIQLLPLNDVGFDFRPYDSQSSFALETMHLSIESLVGVDLKPFKTDIARLRKQFPVGNLKVNYQIKAAKLKLLWSIFQSVKKSNLSGRFRNYVAENAFWLEDYVLFKVIKENQGQRNWFEWPNELKNRLPEALEKLRKNFSGSILFHQWLQWQAHEQFCQAKKYANLKNVFLMGDLPFLVSQDSADVWANQDYFKLDMASGAPPDSYSATGQRWGMPPYRWGEIAANQYDYLREKLVYAEKFYDLFRIDHFVGIFRVWTVPTSEPLENGSRNGFFDPQDERVWEEHGRKILDVMMKTTSMLPCAEDLGVVPECSWRALEHYGIVGMDIPRWMRDWDHSYDFKSPEHYRKNSIVMFSTHDMSPLKGWWEYEIETVDETWFRKKCSDRNIDFESMKELLFDMKASGAGRLRWKEEIKSKEPILAALRLSENDAYEFINSFKSSFSEREKFCRYIGLKTKAPEKVTSILASKILERASESASVFSIQLLQDWLSLDTSFKYDTLEYRINVPATTNDKNWTLVAPLSLDKMLEWKYLADIKKINRSTKRI